MSDAFTCSEYAAEHHALCRAKERERRNVAYASPQLQFRKYLVSWLRMISEKLKLSTCSLHLAVYLLDIFMDNHYIESYRLHLVTLVCLQVAAKYEERDVTMPKIGELNQEAKSKYVVSDFQHVEVLLLNFLDWNLNLPTAAHFAEYYSLFAVFRKDWNPMEYVSYETFWKEAQRAVKDFLDLTLIDITLVQFKPSLVASSCILLARQQLRLNVKWTEELIKVTNYHYGDLLPCANTILSRGTSRTMDSKRKIEHSPDVGYATGGSDSSSPEIFSSKRRCLGRKRKLKY